ncbi:mandelate racemase/muconate lactonizing enzyme family protein [Sphingomonas sp.]|uniref:mandelate racemase/muconate lactonizing enzyme family protein n=1 Tax=Sphingomonas sp. TaxID=28214 RepID=UPI0031DB294D
MATAPALAAPPRAAARRVVGELEIFRIPVNHRGDWILVRLGGGGALKGLGDASHGGDDARTIAYLRRFAELLRGRSIFDVEWFRQATAKAIATEPRASAIVAASALEQCLWDLIGHALEVPVHDLFGGRLRDSIPLYANINRSTIQRTPDGFARMAEKAVAGGFDAIKLAPFDAIPADPAQRGDIRQLTDQGVACAAAVRQAIGPGRRLLIDAHSRFTREQGIELAARLAPLDLYWLEEVTPADPITDLAAINRAAAMPTAGGEAVRGIAAFYDYIRAGAVDIAMPDVKICGGMLELRKIAALAEAAGLDVSPHGPASPVGNLAAAHVAATLPNFQILEHAFGEVSWRDELLAEGEPIRRGSLLLGFGPGLGASLNEQLLTRLSRR